MKTINRFLAGLLAVIIAAAAMPVPSFASEDVFYIRNNYTTDAFLYESDGVLRYGIPLKGDKEFLWTLEECNGSSLIKNLATGRYITLSGHADESVEGYWGDIVSCLDFAEGDDTFLWTVSPQKGQNIISASTKYSGFSLHLENASNGQVIGQKISGDQLNWGNMKWDFLREKDINFSSMVRDGFCIQNSETGEYLRADDGSLTTGIPDGPDDAFIWIIELKDDGSKAIKNKKSSLYLSVSKSDSALSCTGYSDGEAAFLWDFQISREVKIVSTSPDNEGQGIYVQDGAVKYGDLKKLGNKSAMKWNFISSVNVADVAGPLILEDGLYVLKNSWFGMYMIDDGGIPVYGNARSTDPAAQWRIIYDEGSGLTALLNEGTKRYLHVSSSGQLVCDNTESYYWMLERNKNALYPNAVQFRDSVNPGYFLHMESFSGVIENSNAVQPSWGTPHWEPIRVDDLVDEKREPTEIPKRYIRLKSLADPTLYLYENAAGALTYGDCRESDAKSHWEIVESSTEGNFLLKNREYEHYITSKGSGALRCVGEEEAKTEGSLWQISAGSEPGTLIFNNAYSDMAQYKRPYLNIRKMSGFAQSTLVSVEEATTQWLYEAAPDETEGVSGQEENLVPISAFPDTNLYRIIHDLNTLSGVYRLEYYGSKVRITDTSDNRYLYYEDGWKTKDLTANNDPQILWDMDEKAGIVTLKNGQIKIQPEKILTDSFYSADSAFIMADRMIFTVYSYTSGVVRADIGYSGPKTGIHMEINGISRGKVSLPHKGSIEIYLNKGINTVTLSRNDGITGLTLHESINKDYRGATATYIRYEAEDCSTTGTPVEEDRNYRTFSSEASGRVAITLDRTGQYVRFTLTKPANAMVIRYCVPDSADGTELDSTLNLYIDGKKTKSIDLTSRYSWVYGSYPWTNDPGDGMAHHFYDEVRVMLDKTYPAGTAIKLQKDAANTAQYYIIDLIETEEVAPPHQMPENALSIEDFGAVPNDGTDDTKAIADCISKAVAEGKEVWIPAGVFEINTPTRDFDAGDNQNKNRGFVLTKDNLVIRGAGMWHSVLKGEYAAFFVKANNIAFYDFSLAGTAVSRRDSIDPSAIETDYNTPTMKNLIVQNVWIDHYKTGIWTHNLDGMHVVGCRIRNTFADGLNLRRGTSNSVVEQCDVRNTGDDAIALWSSDYNDTNNKIRFNTVSLQWLANSIALYGGKDIEITDNIISDTVVNGAGVNISTNFDPKPFEGTIAVERNSLIRCGSHDYNHNMDNGAIWFNTVLGNDNKALVVVKDNLILNSTWQGISFMNKGTVANVLMEGNTIEGCGSFGIHKAPGARGRATARNNLIRSVMLEKINNEAENTFDLAVEVEEDRIPATRPLSKRPDIKILMLVSAAVLIVLSGLGIYFRIKKSKK